MSSALSVSGGRSANGTPSGGRSLHAQPPQQPAHAARSDSRLAHRQCLLSGPVQRACTAQEGCPQDTQSKRLPGRRPSPRQVCHQLAEQLLQVLARI